MTPDNGSKTPRLTRFLRSATRPLREAASTGTRPLHDHADAPTQPVRGAAGADTVRIEQAWAEPVTETVPNLDKRVMLVLILDTSDSMNWSIAHADGLTPISQLNAGLQSLRQALMDDPDARRRVEVAMLTFGGTPKLRALHDGSGSLADEGDAFVQGVQFTPPELAAGGVTPMAAAIEQALDLVETRKDALRERGIPYYRPWLMVISDGEPTDIPAEWERAVERVRRAQQAQRALVFPIGVENADMERLDALIWNDPAHPEDHYSAMKLKGLRFDELFVWLTASVRETMTQARDNPRSVMSRQRQWDQMDV